MRPLPDGRDARPTQRLVRLEPVDAVRGPSHPPAGAGALRPGPGPSAAQPRTDPESFTVFPADAPLPDHAGLRRVPLVEPAPLYAWSPARRESSRHPLLGTLPRGFAKAGRARRRPEYIPGRDWLPDTDHPKLAARRDTGSRSRGFRRPRPQPAPEPPADSLATRRYSALMRCASSSWSSRMTMRHAASIGVPLSTSSRARAAIRSW